MNRRAGSRGYVARRSVSDVDLNQFVEDGECLGAIGRRRGWRRRLRRCWERWGLSGHEHFSHHHGFANGFAPVRDAQTQPYAEGREEGGDERAVDLDGVLDDDETVFSVLKNGDEEAADDTEDEDVAPHDGVAEKYSGDGEEVASGREKGRDSRFGTRAWSGGSRAVGGWPQRNEARPGPERTRAGLQRDWLLVEFSAAPVTFDPVPAAGFMAPVAGDPFGVGARRFGPAAFDPDVGMAIPAMVAGNPDPSIVRTGSAVLDARGRRADLHVNALSESGGNRGEAEQGRGGDKKQFLHRSGFSFH